MLRAVGSVESVTLGGSFNGGDWYDGDKYAKKWGRHGDFWHWYREDSIQHNHRNCS